MGTMLAWTSCTTRACIAVRQVGRSGKKLCGGTDLVEVTAPFSDGRPALVQRFEYIGTGVQTARAAPLKRNARAARIGGSVMCEHEDVLEAMQRRLGGSPCMTRVRRRTVEHRFGTIQFSMGTRHFPMRSLRQV